MSEPTSGSDQGRLAVFDVAEPDDQVSVHHETPVACRTVRPKRSAGGPRWAQVLYGQTFSTSLSEPSTLRLGALNLAIHATVAVLAEQGAVDLVAPAIGQLEERFYEEASLQPHVHETDLRVDGGRVRLPSMLVHGILVAWMVTPGDGFALAWPEREATDHSIRLVSASEVQSAVGGG